MSDESTAPTYTVTLNTGDDTTVGTLAWALTQANAYEGEGTPTIAFAENLGKAGFDYSPRVNVERDMRYVNLGNEPVRAEIEEIAEGVVLTVESGVKIGGGGGWASLSVKGHLDCREGSIISGPVWVTSSAAQVTMQGTRVEGIFSLMQGAAWEAEDVTFAETGVLQLADWSGNPAEYLSSLGSKLSCEGEGLRVQVATEQDYTLSEVSGLKVIYEFAESGYEGGAAGHLGQVVTLEGVVIDDMNRSFYCTLDCRSGTVLRGFLDFKSDATLKLNGARVEGGITFYGGSLEGTSATFSEDARISLYDSGNPADFFSGLSNVTVEGGALKVNVCLEDGRETILSAISGIPVEYGMNGLSATSTAILAEGMSLSSGDYSCTLEGTLVCQKNSVLKNSIDLAGKLILNEARVEAGIYLQENAHMEADGVTFTDSACVVLQSYEGTPSEALAGLRNVNVEGEALRVVIPQADEDCTLTPLCGVKIQYEMPSVGAGVTVTVEQDASLQSSYWSPLYVEGTLDCRVGSVLKGDITVESGGVLKLYGTRVEGTITLKEGARVEGVGNEFVAFRPFEASGDVNLTEALSGLLDNPYTTSAASPYVSLSSLPSSGDITLPALSAPFLGYRLGSYAYLSGTYTFAEGADLYLEAYYGMTQVSASLVFEGQGHLYLMDVQTQELVDTGLIALVSNGLSTEEPMLFDLGSAVVHGTLDVGSGVDFRANGATFCAEEALILNLTDWDGTTTPACLATLQGCHFAEGAYTSYKINGLGGRNLSWNEASMQALLTPAGCGRAEVEYLSLNEGDSLTLAANTHWENRPIVVNSGATLTCGKGCSLTAGIYRQYEEDDIIPNPALIVHDGGTLVANDLHITGALVLSPGSKLEGSLHFEKGSRIRLQNWSGSTQQLLDTVLADVNWTSDEPLVIEFTDYAYEYETSVDEYGTPVFPYAFVGDAVLADLGSKFGYYLFPEPNGMGYAPYDGDCHVTVSRGVDIAVEDGLFCSETFRLTFEGENTVRSAGTEPYVGLYPSYGDSGGPYLTAHGTRFEIPVLGVSSGKLSGENITFASSIPYGISVGGYDNETSSITGWDGSAAALQAANDAAMQGVSGYRITASNALLGIYGYIQAENLTLSPAALSGILPAGFSNLYFDDTILAAGCCLTVPKGATLNLDGLVIEGGATLIMEAGSALVDPLEGRPDISVSGEGQSCGTLSVTGVDLNGVSIYGHGDINLNGCWGKGSLEFFTSYQYGSVCVTGCDLSQVDVRVLSDFYEEGNNIVLDFSGNYWGTTDLEAIKARIDGYDERYITLGTVLASSPFGPDTTPPEVSLLAPQAEKTAEGQTTVTLGWSASADAVRYELKVDGKSVYKGSDTTCTLTLKDGSHRYSVTAWDEAGNRATVEGEAFTLDATAPELKLNAPQMERPGDGTTRVTLSWAANESASYVLTVGEETFYPTGNTHTIELADGEYSYSLTATDEEGNSCTLGGNFTCDSTAPLLSMAAPELTPAGKGKTKVLFCWSGEAGSTYDLYVDDRKVYTGRGGSYRCTLKDGTHHYTLMGTDASGNTTQLSDTVQTDGTAPTITLQQPTISKAGEKLINVTLNWQSNEPARYTVQVDDMAVEDAGNSSSFSLPCAIADGRHRYTITATDGMGNTSKVTGSFSYDAAAPSLSLKTPTLKKAGESLVRATLKWSAEKGATYRVCVDGDPTLTYEGKGSSCTFTLADGEHRYTVTATDAAGNSSSTEGSFSYDATAPELELLAPQLSKAGSGKIYATLSWEGSGAESYTLTVDGKKKYTGDASEYSLDLKDGKHSYSITAVDAAGNKTTQSGSFSYDATPPKLSVKKPKLSKAGQGLIDALFSWSTEKGCTSKLIVDGVERYSGTGSTCLLQLEGDKHSYYVETQDAAGNTTRSEEAGLSLDTTNPLFVLSAPAGSINGSSVATTLSWLGEAGASYTVMIDHKKVMSGKKLSCTAKLTPGEHQLSITAKDAAGNSTTLSTTLSVSALGEAPSFAAPSAARDLLWQAEDSEGIREHVGWGNSADSYRLTLAEDSTLSLKLSGLENSVNLSLARDYGLGVAEQLERISVTGEGIDRELNLSAGTYYLQIEGCDPSLVACDTDYLLDVELACADERKQAVLADARR